MLLSHSEYSVIQVIIVLNLNDSQDNLALDLAYMNSSAFGLLTVTKRVVLFLCFIFLNLRYCLISLMVIMFYINFQYDKLPLY